jgi:metal transporter CNNM
MLTVLVTLFLISLSAIFSGLTIGLLTLGPHELKRKIELGDDNARKIYPIRKKGNLLLVTLCLSNVAVNAALSIFLGSLASGLIAGLLSTALITVFGEIAPQAIFSRFAMELGARSVWLVRIFLFVLYPVCAPLAWILDKTLGDELPTVYSKKELVQILEEHGTNIDSDVQEDEERIARGALSYGQEKISDVMTPRSVVVSVREDDVLTPELIAQLTKHGYSRYPVFDKEKEKFVGLLYMYKLVDQNLHSRKVSEVCDKPILFLNMSENLDHALSAFLKTKHHLYGVVNSFGEIVGILGIEDILEEIIGAEIVDEFDEYDNVRAVAEKSQAK